MYNVDKDMQNIDKDMQNIDKDMQNMDKDMQNMDKDMQNIDNGYGHEELTAVNQVNRENVDQFLFYTRYVGQV